MADSLQNDRKSLRTCILYEVRHGRNVEEAYKNVCKVFGNDTISYIDFDYWFYRFYNGNQDLDYDKERDPKSLLFSDLSADAIGKVVEKLGLKEQLTLRRVSHGFRFIVDQKGLAYKTIRVTCKSDSVSVYFNGHIVVYMDHTANDSSLSGAKRIIRCQKEEDFVERAFNDIAIAMKNPKVKLESFYFNYESYRAREGAKKNAMRIFEDTKSLLKSLNHKISVKWLGMSATNQKNINEFLSYLKAGILEKIQIVFIPENSSTTEYVTPQFVEIDEIITLDQWKMAKHVTINTSVSAPIETFFNFKSFELRLESNIIETLIHLRDTLPKLAEIPQCTLRFKMNSNIEHYKKILGLTVPRDARHDRVLHYPIPGSNQHLQFNFGGLSILIKKSHS